MSVLDGYNERKLLSQLKKGDIKAFENIFNLYYSRLCEYSFFLTAEKAEAEEIVQKLFINLWENRETNKIHSLKPYLFKAIHNNSIKYINRKKTKAFAEKDFNLLEDSSPENEYYLDLYEKLEECIDELPEKCKKIFILSKFDNLKHKEIAQKLDISPKTVEVQVRRAKLFLKEKLKKYVKLLIYLYIISKGF